MVKVLNMKGSNEPKLINVTEEDGTNIISLKKSPALPTRVRYLITNNNNEKIGTIEKSRSNFSIVNLPEINISINDDKIKLKKDMKELKDIYEIEGSGFSIIGNWFGPTFNITKNEKVIAFVKVEQEELGRSYLADIIDKSNEEQIISILFAVSWLD
ncbi:Uncharacterised protein [uncultured Clostridium sp.]|uniref:hypothetical protein n=1 Tax=uncultured Clostridium sp. TaxID=59620 RepID=UPI000821FCCD|nr:hypothetical protein [uncultured Clostridium sp.]SCJ38652.1 Uncharacterised protein [uncultured Clostridium sp.]